MVERDKFGRFVKGHISLVNILQELEVNKNF